MLEKVRETRELVFDLYLNYYSSDEPENHKIDSEVKFEIVSQPEKMRIFPETYRLDFESEWAGDKPGYIVPAAEKRDVLIYPKTGFYESEFDEKYILEQIELAGPGAKEWLYFSRVLIEIDSEYVWDFDDEEGMSNFNEEVLDPIFDCFRPQFGNLRVTSYFVDP